MALFKSDPEKAAQREIDAATANRKNYRIEAYQTEIRRWRARIRRLDGKKVKVAATGEQHELLPTAAARGAMTARTAIDVVKALIDDGSID